MFWGAFGFEAGLGLFAIGLGLLLGIPAARTLTLDLAGWVGGVVATLPMLVLLGLTLRSSHPALVELRAKLDEMVVPAFAGSSALELAALSAGAGFGEELLFRGLIQGGVESWVGVGPSLVFGSLIFGLAHPISRVYVLFAAIFGFYLGAIWLFTGNLLVPMVAHGLYDFVALRVVLGSSEVAVTSQDSA